MAAKSFGDDFRDECAKKAIMWGPAIAGALVLGAPLGIAAGLLTSVVMLASGGGGTSSRPDGDQETK
jgi:hypothetical protein